MSGRPGTIAKPSAAMLIAWLAIYSAGPLTADEPPTQAEIRAAVERGLAALDLAATRYSQHRHCFSCHHQTLPLLAQVTARSHGLMVDKTLLKAQLQVMTKTFEDE